LAYKIQTPGNYPEEIIQHSEHGESLKSRILHLYGEEKESMLAMNSCESLKSSIQLDVVFVVLLPQFLV